MENEPYKGKYSSLPVYEAVKNYFLFYFPDFLPVYYSSKEISALYEIVSNKDEGVVFEKWKALLALIKAKYPSFILQNFKSRRPSYTVKILISANEHTEINAYVSISLLGKFYALFLEEKRQDETIQYISPFGIHETLLKELESHVETIFSEYVFICFSLLRMNFFNLIVPGLNTANSTDGRPDKQVTLLQGLFFNYDLNPEGFIGRMGNSDYKTETCWSWEIDSKKLETMKQALFDTEVIFQEI